jgi:lipid-A-disaccharide synthase
MLVLFPFEKTFYGQYGVHADYVGHPLVDKHAAHLPPIAKSLDPANCTLGLLPGSRRQEVLYLLPRMLQCARQLYASQKIHRVQIVKVKNLPDGFYIQGLQPADSFVEIVEEPLAQCLPRYDAAIVASGTATLETAYFGVPQLIVYHVNPLTYWLGRALIKVKYIGLANIVAEKEVAPELIQHAFTPDKASQIIAGMLNADRNRQIRDDLQIIREKLGQPGASQRAATIIREYLYADKR